MSWCPEKGFGKHAAAGTHASGHAEEDNSYFTRTDNTSASFSARTASKAKLTGKDQEQLKVSATAISRHFRGSHYDPTSKAYPAKKVAFQVKSGSRWRTCTAVNLNVKGSASVTVEGSKKSSYRLAVPKTSPRRAASPRQQSRSRPGLGVMRGPGHASGGPALVLPPDSPYDGERDGPDPAVKRHDAQEVATQWTMDLVDATCPCRVS